MQRTLREIYLRSKLDRIANIHKEEKDKIQKSFNEATVLKDKDLNASHKKLEELNNVVMSLKAKENELASLIKQKEKQISALEAEKSKTETKYNLGNRRNTGQGDDLQQLQLQVINSLSSWLIKYW